MRAGLQYRIKASGFFPCLVIFIALIFLKYFAEVNIPSFVFIFISLIIALSSDKEEIIIFGICCIPMLNMFQSKYSLLICMIIYIYRFSNEFKKVNSIVIILGILMTWELPHALFGQFSLVEYLRIFTELIFFVFVVICDITDMNFQKLFRVFALVTISICFVILLIQLKAYSYNVSLLLNVKNFRLAYAVDDDILGASFNPNSHAYICLLAIEGLCLLRNSKETKPVDIVMIVLLCIFGVMTLSRKFVLCGFLFLVLYILSQNDRKERVKRLFILGIVSIAVILLLSYFFPTIIDSMVNRFTEDDVTSGRTDLFSFYTNALFEKPVVLLFGVGLLDYRYKVFSTFGYFNIPHNGIQELLVMWGIPGLIMFALLIYFAIKRAKGDNKIPFVYYIPLIVMLFFIQGAQMVSSSIINMIWVYIYLCLLYGSKQFTKLSIK